MTQFAAILFFIYEAKMRIDAFAVYADLEISGVEIPRMTHPDISSSFMGDDNTATPYPFRVAIGINIEQRNFCIEFTTMSSLEFDMFLSFLFVDFENGNYKLAHRSLIDFVHDLESLIEMEEL